MNRTVRAGASRAKAGHGIVDVLWGDVPPSGRPPVSLPRRTEQVPLHHDRLPTGRSRGGDRPARRPCRRVRDLTTGERARRRAPWGHGEGVRPELLGKEVVATTGTRT